MAYIFASGDTTVLSSAFVALVSGNLRGNSTPKHKLALFNWRTRSVRSRLKLQTSCSGYRHNESDAS